MTINVGIVGATGHTGEELIGILLKHPSVRIAKLYNTSETPQLISEVFPKFKNKINLACKKIDLKEIDKTCDLVFLALPHTVSMSIAPAILKLGKPVIDLSADYRLKNLGVYKKYYHVTHSDTLHVKEAVYGLPELYRSSIKRAKLIANPGCYPTCAILGLAPAVSLGVVELDSIIIDAKSGVTGAGKKLTKEFLFSEVNEDFRAYKVNAHQHAPEINQILSKLAVKKINTVFVPHLLPLERGILATMYLKKKKTGKAKTEDLITLYKKFYKNEPFVRIKEAGQFPRIKDVVGTNFCDIGILEEEKMIIIIAAIDNLVKGASGQAVQNMNIMCKIPEHLGLL